MADKFSGKPRDYLIGEEISHSAIPQKWRFLRQLLLPACPRKPQQYSVYARLETHTYLGMASEGLGLHTAEGSLHFKASARIHYLAIRTDELSHRCLLLFVSFLASLALFLMPV